MHTTTKRPAREKRLTGNCMTGHCEKTETSFGCSGETYHSMTGTTTKCDHECHTRSAS